MLDVGAIWICRYEEQKPRRDRTPALSHSTVNIAAQLARTCLSFAGEGHYSKLNANVGWGSRDSASGARDAPCDVDVVHYALWAVEGLPTLLHPSLSLFFGGLCNISVQCGPGSLPVFGLVGSGFSPCCMDRSVFAVDSTQ